MLSYQIPAKRHATEINVLKSRFITNIAFAPTVDDARQSIAIIRAEMPDANHHVYAFRVGYGNSVIEGMSDDGEPTGTSGPPTLAVVRGSDLGDIVVVTTRYFGGTKLGKGGLVRAYTESAQVALETLDVEIKAEKQIIGIDMPYHLYETVKRLVLDYNGIIQDETFAEDVTLVFELLAQDVDEFEHKLTETSSGQLALIILENKY